MYHTVLTFDIPAPVSATSIFNQRGIRGGDAGDIFDATSVTM